MGSSRRGQLGWRWSEVHHDWAERRVEDVPLEVRMQVGPDGPVAAAQRWVGCARAGDLDGARALSVQEFRPLVGAAQRRLRDLDWSTWGWSGHPRPVSVDEEVVVAVPMPDGVDVMEASVESGERVEFTMRHVGPDWHVVRVWRS